MSELGAVAIGRNEGERLRACLASLAGRGFPVVYVDSGSTDGSVATARSMGAEVVELDPGIPFSAARARNAGFEALRRVDPAVELVLFVDGDCEVAEGWVDRAVAELETRPDAAVVCGRRREKFPEATIYNRLADLEWDTPVGQAIACGGDAVMRASAFEAVGGFDPSAVAGEEPQLCQRLRRAGWTIWRVDAEMTRHDLAMSRFAQWWRRQYRGGYNALDIATRFPGPDRLFVDELKRARIWGAAIPAAIAIGSVGMGLAFGPIVGLVAAVVGLMVYPLQALRLAQKVRKKVEGHRIALAYGVLMTLAKWANLWGQVNYLIDRRRGRSGRLIEYKSAGAPRRPVGATPATAEQP